MLSTKMVVNRLHLLSFAVAFAAFFCLCYGEEIFYIIGLLQQLIPNHKARATYSPVISEPVAQWPEPPASIAQLTGDNATRILWGYWHDGRDAMPGLCQLAVRSWQVRNPDWKVIIVSDHNYRQYLSPSDVPSTFASLKVQHRSDIVRLAVLIRYGGLYLDASYLVLKGFDNLWDTAFQNNDLFLVTALTLQRSEIDFPLNALILAPRPANPLLMKWRKRILDYLENPCTSLYDMKSHPSMLRVARHFDDPALGGLANSGPYMSLLWILTDLLYYEASMREYVRQHVHYLPTLRWTFDFLMVDLIQTADDDINDMKCRSMSLWSMLQRLPNALELRFNDDPELASRLFSNINAMKSSSALNVDFHEPPEYHLSRNCTASRGYRAALDTRLWPTQQATHEGAYRVIPFS